MKRTVRKPDGSEEVMEGTAEELAEYERKLNSESRQQPAKPGLLRGKDPLDFFRDRDPLDFFRENPDSPWPNRPIWVVSCSICQRINCSGCGHFPTYTSDRTAIG